jgi:hypothetical protein
MPGRLTVEAVPIEAADQFAKGRGQGNKRRVVHPALSEAAGWMALSFFLDPHINKTGLSIPLFDAIKRGMPRPYSFFVFTLCPSYCSGPMIRSYSRSSEVFRSTCFWRQSVVSLPPLPQLQELHRTWRLLNSRASSGYLWSGLM